MGIDTEERAETTSAHAEGAEATPAFGTVFAAGADLVQSLRRIAMVFLGSVALVAFSVSLWACAVALIGWAFVKATGSIGIALGLLVLMHLILVAAIWFAIKRAIHHASFPGTRTELRALGNELRGHVERFQNASPPPDREVAP